MDQNLQGTFVQSGLCLFPPLPAVCPNDPPLCLANASPYWMPEPILSGSSSLKKNWMQLIPIELTSCTSLYAEKYFGETFKELSKQLLSFSYPVSILARIVLEHLRKASSTLSPVFALVSRKMRSFSWANLSKKYFNCQVDGQQNGQKLGILRKMKWLQFLLEIAKMGIDWAQ